MKSWFHMQGSTELSSDRQKPPQLLFTRFSQADREARGRRPMCRCERLICCHLSSVEEKIVAASLYILRSCPNQLSGWLGWNREKWLKFLKLHVAQVQFFLVLLPNLYAWIITIFDQGAGFLAVNSVRSHHSCLF